MAVLLGSSPRMRGTQPRKPPECRPTGIIPADAGNTDTVYTNGIKNVDQPRGCGEHVLKRPFDTVCRGSSPRMRGTLAKLNSMSDDQGIIPADAGNT